MDGALQRTGPLQLVAAVLPARRRGDYELGRYRQMYDQPGFYTGRLSRIARQTAECGADDATRRMVAKRTTTARQGEYYAISSNPGNGKERRAGSKTTHQLLH